MFDTSIGLGNILIITYVGQYFYWNLHISCHKPQTLSRQSPHSTQYRKSKLATCL